MTYLYSGNDINRTCIRTGHACVSRGEERFRLIVDSYSRACVRTLNAAGEVELPSTASVLEYFGKTAEELKNWSHQRRRTIPTTFLAWHRRVEALCSRNRAAVWH